jgi:hypothetical protein
MGKEAKATPKVYFRNEIAAGSLCVQIAQLGVISEHNGS